MTKKKDGTSRAQQVEPGHLPVSEWAGMYAGNQPPFGDDASDLPMGIDKLKWDYSAPQPPRILDEERRLAEYEEMDRQEQTRRERR
ncbi:hypothetical protein [Natronoglycomyces albus]|uniref:Uncharacterized protein n=1 Tax=Natronoglycomyces albus TaxID=2811108 RepID=A0A895XPK3_9ACTN|nr:hypothetical protein [Natronoglycomyces albus]QSB05473.1 hypothetical protein JQS30_00570 [Natronoglycomyces albus]